MNKKTILFSIAIFVFAFCQAQKLPPVCHGLKFDTIRTTFIAELDAKYKSYDVAGRIVQDNMIFLLTSGNLKPEFSSVYQSDSVIIKLSNKAKVPQSCSNMVSIKKLYQYTDISFFDKEMKKKSGNNFYMSDWGIHYLIFSAELIVVNLGAQTIKSPVANRSYIDQKQSFTEKKYNNVLVVTSIRNFKANQLIF